MLIVEVLVFNPFGSWAASEVSKVCVEDWEELPSKLSFEVCELTIVRGGTCPLTLMPMLLRSSNWDGLGPSRCSTPEF